jgi:predicted RNA-binding protein (virulence factor B family)
LEDKNINQDINLGEINSLLIDRKSDHGFYLIPQNDDEEVLLPNIYITESMDIGKVIDVFIYTDSEDRIVATTETPYILNNQYAYLTVVDVASFGAFVDIGLKKDILVPKNKQARPFEVGQKKILKLVVDENTYRLIATEKFQASFSKDTDNLEKKQKVEILIYMKSPLGYKVIVNNLYSGLVFENETFEKLKIGDKKEGYIKAIREDGKLDISLQPIGKDNLLEASTKKVFAILQEKKEINLNYKSDAEDIKNVFGVSKKSFKRALTHLKDNNFIEITENSIKLIP